METTLDDTGPRNNHHQALEPPALNKHLNHWLSSLTYIHVLALPLTHYVTPCQLVNWSGPFCSTKKTTV